MVSEYNHSVARVLLLAAWFVVSNGRASGGELIVSCTTGACEVCHAKQVVSGVSSSNDLAVGDSVIDQAGSTITSAIDPSAPERH